MMPGQTGGKRTYTYEFIGIVLGVVYIINYFIGRRQNQELANAWYDQFAPFVHKHFAEVGLGTAKPGEKMIKESQSTWKLYASGRRFCKGLVVELSTVGRHDLISLCLNIFKPSYDTVTLDVPMNDDCMDPFVFALLRRKEYKSAHAESKDLKDFAKVMPLEMLPPSLVALTDCPEVVMDLLQPVMVKTLQEHTKYFNSLHFTDQNTVSTLGTTMLSPKALRFQFRLPTKNKMADLDRLMQMALWCVDVVGQQLRLSRSARARAEGARKKVADRAFKAGHEIRAERLQQKKADARAREREEYENMTTEQKRRFDEREDKKKAKKKNPRFRVKMSAR